MPIFRKGPEPFALHISMTGIKMGDRILQLGAGDGRLFAALAAKVGLTGRACLLDATVSAVERARRAAAKEGVLVEVSDGSYRMLPYDTSSFDIVVICDVLATMTPDMRVGCLKEARRVLREGGRCLVIEPATRGGLGRLLTREPPDRYYVSSGGAATALETEGFRAVRVLAEREGHAFTEGAKPRKVDG